MLELWLERDYFVARSGKRQIKVDLQDFILPITRHEFSLDKHLASVSDIELAYIECMRQGFSEDKLIQQLIDNYLPVKYFKAGDYERTDMVIGLCGHRGSGKTVGAVGIGLFDYLLRGKDVWSNVPIEVKVCYRNASRVYASKDVEQVDLLDLDGGYKGGMVLADECNLRFASAYKVMSNPNQDFAGMVQQIRKRHMSIVWTAQSFMSVDKNLRWQTDFMVGCRDQHLSGRDKVMGDKSEWKVYDIGGLTGEYSLEYELSHPYITQFEVWQGDHYNHPLWWAYDSYTLQGGNYIAEYRANKGKKLTVNDELVQQTENQIDNYILQLITAGVKRFWARELWESQGIATDGAAQQMWGRVLAAAGYERKRNGQYFYELKEKT